MLYCCDCIHYRCYDARWTGFDACAHPNLPDKRDVVRGQSLLYHCSDVRGFSGPCGREGKLFQGKADAPAA